MSQRRSGMEKEYKKLPIGVDSFEKLIRGDYYYLDKTLFVKELLLSHGEVNLFTRPRRFGKTLNMSMLKAFFEIGSDRDLFTGLKIEQEEKICRVHQGQYPVVFLSLKGVEGRNYTEAIEMFASLIAKEGKRFSYLLGSGSTEASDQEILEKLIYRKGDITDLKTSLVTIMRMLKAYYGKPVILLLDEYDVPLDKANENGYYPEMVSFLRGFMGEAFKTNSDLYFAVVTGCLRISKESIFTGVNNLKTDTISDVRYDEFFGFTEEDVRIILKDYELTEAYTDIKEWYDGYRFGDTNVYCPWDVVNHCDRLLADPDAKPRLYWNNTSSNQIVKLFVDIADATTRRDIEELIAGKTIYKTLSEDLTYGELESSPENLWSVLYLTGYLTSMAGRRDIPFAKVPLVIPNKEIREIFVEKVQKWFEERVNSSHETLSALYRALQSGNADEVEAFLQSQLRATISYYDGYESFYHGFVLGLLKGNGKWTVLSNREAGNGRSDIQIECGDGETGIIIEIKCGKDKASLAGLSEAALNQVVEKSYTDSLYNEDIARIWIFGISFYRKSCCVCAKRVEINQKTSSGSCIESRKE